MDLPSLLLDVKTLIAACFQEVWITLYVYDRVFRDYATTTAGRMRFVELFTVKTIYDGGGEDYRLLGQLHRSNDLPR
jgi:hypothetical protein